MKKKFKMSDENIEMYLKKFFGIDNKIYDYDKMIDIYRFWLGEIIDSSDKRVKANYSILRIIVYCFKEFIKRIDSGKEIDIDTLKEYVLDKYFLIKSKNVDDDWMNDEMIFFLTFEINRSICELNLEEYYMDVIYDMYCNLYVIEEYNLGKIISKNKKLS